MIKKFTPVLLALGLLAYACQSDEEPPQIQSLAHTHWEVTGYMPETAAAMHSSPIKYRLAFLSDSTFILKLDANALTGKFSYGPGGTFRVTEVKKTQDCCDNVYALEMEAIFKSATDLTLRQDMGTLAGKGELYLRRK
ncbi:MAG: META domain-containing protein [Lunatimonas sp.]|uniref:META domain-containing protein n=1 Tax=Lunatimonas sp. TaxID=2060141 RepID=UPI00263BD2E0|nr:META domain-containing protein [Lunatimonas sp.]MCC5938032.1 META domain-containing protein [Lunatimonas sp.]